MAMASLNKAVGSLNKAVLMGFLLALTSLNKAVASLNKAVTFLGFLLASLNKADQKQSSLKKAMVLAGLLFVQPAMAAVGLPWRRVRFHQRHKCYVLLGETGHQWRPLTEDEGRQPEEGTPAVTSDDSLPAGVRLAASRLAEAVLEPGRADVAAAKDSVPSRAGGRGGETESPKQGSL